MLVRLGVVCTVLLTAALLAGCGSDSDSGSVSTATTAAIATAKLTPRTAFLTPGDLPGYIEVESSPGGGICGFRLVELAANGGRITFQNSADAVLVEQLVLLFKGDAEASVNAFEDAVKGCRSDRVGDYTLKYAMVPVNGFTADQVIGVRAVSTAGKPPIRSLTIVARDGDEVVSVAAVAAKRYPKAVATRTARVALKRLQQARAKVK